MLCGKNIEEDKENTGAPCVVYLPPGYGDEASNDTNNGRENEEPMKRYPIIYHLQGAGASYSGVKQHISSIGHSLEANNVEMIVVCPHDPTSFPMWAGDSNIDIASKIHNKTGH